MSRPFVHIVRLLCAAIALLWLWGGCKPKKQEIPPFGDVHLQALDENKQPIDTATVFLYNSKDAFDQAVANAKKGVYNGNGSIATGKISNGKISFPDLPSNADYWVLAHDTNGVFLDENDNPTSYPLVIDNADAYYYIPAFQNGTVVSANITLVPAFSLLKISTDSISDPLSVIDISDSVYSNASVSDPILVRKGTLPYFIRSQSCLWTGSVDAVAGRAVTVKLASCGYDKATFSLDPNLISLGTGKHVDIYIGQNKSKPILILRGNTLSGEVVLATGKQYSYYAEMIDSLANKSTCIWEGLVTPSVALSDCN